tara:strand:- start:164 stop:418 length:255 start_codon:yes stop_codon:yes gene_type:complete
MSNNYFIKGTINKSIISGKNYKEVKRKIESLLCCLNTNLTIEEISQTNCLYCNDELIESRKDQKFCSLPKQCKNKYHNQKRKNN